jgi:hypothetical protein
MSKMDADIAIKIIDHIFEDVNLSSYDDFKSLMLLDLTLIELESLMEYTHNKLYSYQQVVLFIEKSLNKFE